LIRGTDGTFSGETLELSALFPEKWGLEGVIWGQIVAIPHLKFWSAL